MAQPIVTQIIRELQLLADPVHKQGMARFGIRHDTALGIRVPVLRSFAKRYKKDHETALGLWETGIHEARLLATFIADPGLVTEELMESWVNNFHSWDICDQACGNLFDRTPFAVAKATAWAKREEEFVRRAGFVLMAELAVHDKKKGDDTFIPFFNSIEEGAADDRNFVKKAVNWALRQIGKRNLRLHELAIACAERVALQKSAPARWVAKDALRELRSEAVEKRMMKKS